MIDRAKAAGVSVMFVTVDLPYRGQRHADIKNGLTVPPRLTMRNAWDVDDQAALGDDGADEQAQDVRQSRDLSRPRHRRGEERLMGAGQLRPDASTGATSTGSAKRWDGKIVLKGILDVEDAKRAASEGVDGIVVSNHGGRQLDGASGTIAVLPRDCRRGRRPARSAVRRRRALRPRRLQGAGAWRALLPDRAAVPLWPRGDGRERASPRRSR